MARLAPSEALRATVAASVPLRRLGRPQDVAQVCLFLGSEAAGYVTGAVIEADGGWTQAGARLGTG
jgi:NAD(P)-dependent dehydrogenase (short-subunit alcohol dehydrogenase family)